VDVGVEVEVEVQMKLKVQVQLHVQVQLQVNVESGKWRVSQPLQSNLLETVENTVLELSLYVIQNIIKLFAETKNTRARE